MLNCWCITWPVGFKRLTHLKDISYFKSQFITSYASSFFKCYADWQDSFDEGSARHKAPFITLTVIKRRTEICKHPCTLLQIFELFIAIGTLFKVSDNRNWIQHWNWPHSVLLGRANLLVEYFYGLWKVGMVSIVEPGDRIPWGPKFFEPIQTGPRVHPASYTMGTESLSLGLSGLGVTLSIHPIKRWSYRNSWTIPLLRLWACMAGCTLKFMLHCTAFVRRWTGSCIRKTGTEDL